MKKNIVFLDFDGVLNSIRTTVADQKLVRSFQVSESVKKGNRISSGFDPVAVKLIWRLLELNDAYVVVSSAWRHENNLASLRSIFSGEFGWPSGAEQRIIGMTGHHSTAHRGTEIQNWIDDHTVGVTNFNYVIIDDSSDMLDHQREHFVQTDAREGFLYKDYKKALGIFRFEGVGLE